MRPRHGLLSGPQLSSLTFACLLQPKSTSGKVLGKLNLSIGGICLVILLCVEALYLKRLWAVTRARLAWCRPLAAALWLSSLGRQ